MENLLKKRFSLFSWLFILIVNLQFAKESGYECKQIRQNQSERIWFASAQLRFEFGFEMK